jgi:hypothetical protein
MMVATTATQVHLNGTRARLGVSSWRRNPADCSRRWCYVNSILAKREAKARGFDEAMFTDRSGNVVECTGEPVHAGTAASSPSSTGCVAGDHPRQPDRADPPPATCWRRAPPPRSAAKTANRHQPGTSPSTTSAWCVATSAIAPQYAVARGDASDVLAAQAAG